MRSKSTCVRIRKRTPFMVNPAKSLQFTDSLPVESFSSTYFTVNTIKSNKRIVSFAVLTCCGEEGGAFWRTSFIVNPEISLLFTDGLPVKVLDITYVYDRTIQLSRSLTKLVVFYAYGAYDGGKLVVGWLFNLYRPEFCVQIADINRKV